MEDEPFGLITKQDIPIPLTGVLVRGDIVGRGARVKMVQTFKNQEDRPIEAIYKFPLLEDCAVCKFNVVVGEKVIESIIEEREKAFERYDEALSLGDWAYLLDEERPNIFTLSVGNLESGATALIELDYITLLETQGSEIRFFLPTTISPRYVPPGIEDDHGIPVKHLVNPEYTTTVPYGLSIFLDIKGKDEILSIQSPSHKISTKFEPDLIKVEFSTENIRMDRDFVLSIKYKNEFQSRGYLYKDKEQNFLQVDFCLNEEDLGHFSKREVIFILDCSGSMDGSSISEAKKALDVFFKGLEEGMRFNLYRFGSTFEKLFKESVPYNAENSKFVLRYLKDIKADLGGTEILPPLREIYQI